MTMINKTDAYEFTMAATFIEAGKADEHSVFELFARRLPKGRRFGMMAGIGRAIQEVAEEIVTEDMARSISEFQIIPPSIENWLRSKAGEPLFTGNIYAYREGSLYSPYSPLVRVEGKLIEAIMLETFLLSVLNHDSAVASAAARMRIAAGGRGIIEMGSRRTDDSSAVSAARAAFIAGFNSTSNVQAAHDFDVPLAGTAAHAFTLAFDTELEAFEAQIRTLNVTTTLLVDTYDIPTGIRNAVKAANNAGATGPGAIRIDSGDLLIETHKARILLDELGATSTKIVVSSDLDEYLITELAAAPIDGYGAGTRVVTGSGHPTAGMVYKLVEISGRAVAKKSDSKGSVGGAKTPYLTVDGEELYSLDGSVPAGATPLHVPVIDNGRIVGESHYSLDEIREYAAMQLDSLPKAALSVSDGEAFRIARQEGVRSE